MTFSSRIWHRGFKASSPATDVIENGTFANNGQFAPTIGMSRQGLLSDRAKRRRQGLAPELRPAKLEDLSATARNYVNADWVTSDITLTTDAGQTPIAPGDRIADVTRNGRRTAHFVSHAPILNFFSIQSSDYKLATRDHHGIQLSVYYHQGHDWNVPKMLTAMGAALDYYRANFGPYQFKYARIIEFPGYASFAQAFAGTMPYSGIDRLQCRHQRPDQDRLDDLCRSARNGPPILGPPGDRRRHAGRHADQRDARSIFGADGDEAPVRARQDPPLPQI